MAVGVSGRRLVRRRANVTGPGWTDELARIFDPRAEGPRWQPEFGYSGRPRLRVLLDAEDLCHSYAKAKYLETGKWTGPLSEGIEARQEAVEARKSEAPKDLELRFRYDNI